MRFSLRLIAERLCKKGFHALAINANDSFVRRARLLPEQQQELEAETLYVFSSIDDAAFVSVYGDCCKNGACSFATAQAPTRRWRTPSLIVEGVEATSTLLNVVADAIDELSESFNRMSELAWHEHGLTGIIEELSNLVGNSAYIVDTSFKVVAITDDPDLEEMSVNWMNAARHGYLSYDVIANLIRSNEMHDIESTSVATIVNSEFFYVPFANYNLRQEGKVQGHLFVVQMYKTITECDLELVNLAAPIVLRALQADPAFQMRRGPLYEHFVIDWLTGGLRDQAYIQSQLEALSLNASDLSVVAIVRLPIDSDFRREHLARLLEDRQGCRAVSHDGNVIALFQLKRLKEKDSVLRKVKSICRSQRCRAAVSDVQDSLLNTPRAYRQACEALRIIDAVNLDGDVISYGDVAVYQPYLNYPSVEDLDDFCHPAVNMLREHDRTHAVQLLPTLSAFLKNERDVLATAAELYVHRNTLAYRIKRILEICPIDLDDFNVRHRLLESILVSEHYNDITSFLKR